MGTTMNWDKELTVTLTVRDLFYLHRAAESVLFKHEWTDFTTGEYEGLDPLQYGSIYNAMHKAVAILKENK